MNKIHIMQMVVCVCCGIVIARVYTIDSSDFWLCCGISIVSYWMGWLSVFTDEMDKEKAKYRKTIQSRE